MKDIYQTKRYAEILNASYGFLISPKKLSLERRRFLIERKGQITTFSTDKQVLIGIYDEATKSIYFDTELYGNVSIDRDPEYYKLMLEDLSALKKMK